MGDLPEVKVGDIVKITEVTKGDGNYGISVGNVYRVEWAATHGTIEVLTPFGTRVMLKQQYVKLPHTKFAPGDRVRCGDKKDTVVSVPGMDVYDRVNFECAEKGFRLENEGWCYQSRWELYGHSELYSDSELTTPAHIHIDTKPYKSLEEIVVELKKQIDNKKPTMSLISAFKKFTMREPQKSFVKLGITCENGELTSEGRQLFVQWLFDAQQEAFHKEVAKPMLDAQKEDK